MNYPAPTASNHYLCDHLYLLHSSFQRLLGRNLGNLPWQGEITAKNLFEAPFVLLSHNTAVDPIFTYGNRTAMQLFNMDWQQLTRLPSRFSAEPVAREERERLLQTVTRQGYIDHYTGVRIANGGQRFYIQDAIVWNLLDEKGCYHGQAAFFDRWQNL